MEEPDKIKRPRAPSLNRDRAKDMRHDPVLTEKLFWTHLRNRQLGGFKFRRQVPIGPYIADFVCAERMLIIELDGRLHQGRKDYDAQRDEYLIRLGYRVWRFSNAEASADLPTILQSILHLLRTPSP
jgi:very-short-patch-repair endonuclease